MRAARTPVLNLRERWENRRSGAADADEMCVWPLVLRSLALNLQSGMSLNEAVQSLSYPEEYERTSEDIRRFMQALETTAAWGLSPHLACQQALDEGEHHLQPHSRERMRDLSLSLRMSENAGAPLATSLERAAEHAEERIDAFLGRQSALAAPRATGRILSWLPLIGLGLGVLMGSDPLGVLTGSVAGALTGLLGLALALMGRRWTARLVRRAEEESEGRGFPTGQPVRLGGHLAREPTGPRARRRGSRSVKRAEACAPPGADTALMLELLAAQLRAGLSPLAALMALAEALNSGHLRQICRRLQVGATWEAAWAGTASGSWGQLRDALAPAYTAGSPSAPLLRALADAQRLSERRAAERAAGKLSVALVVPLGLCSLPAFICLGIVPILISLLPTLTG
ncbi:type II secretion system F family protein [Rothia mucilaginosa]|uniref:Type II secretion system F family protein n=1 Tax=Rothia mucilaginosa TaxID=43675 RepID=A0A943T7Y0_9MICC|nr:type II secretion system F family protein [Rothia mucilaginosa]MBS6634096.1 type II secretion system F family protein [Rothia mucilaginosa]